MGHFPYEQSVLRVQPHYALLCAIQAAWAQTQEHNKYGLPEDADPLEGWIADPTLTI